MIANAMLEVKGDLKTHLEDSEGNKQGCNAPDMKCIFKELPVLLISPEWRGEKESLSHRKGCMD